MRLTLECQKCMTLCLSIANKLYIIIGQDENRARLYGRCDCRKCRVYNNIPQFENALKCFYWVKNNLVFTLSPWKYII